MNINNEDLSKYLSKEIQIKDKIEVIYPGKAKNKHTYKGVEEITLATSTANIEELLTKREAEETANKIMKNII